MGTCLWNLNSKYWHCPITNESYWPVPHGPSSRVDPTIIDPELTMAFLNLLLFCMYSILMIFGILNQLSSQTSMIYLAHLSTNTALRCLSSFPWPHFQTAAPWPFLCLSSHPLPSWHHPHQTPSLGPFISDLVALQMQMSQTGVLFQGLGQSLAGDKRFEKHCKKYAKSSCGSSHSHLKMLVSGSKNTWNNKKSMGHQGYTALPICYTLHF